MFTLAPLQALAPSAAIALATSVEFQHPGDTAVDVTELAWREADRPHLTHQAGFAPKVAAAPSPRLGAAGQCLLQAARYDEEGYLRATARNGARPFADRAAQIQAMAERLLGGRTARARTAPAPVRATADSPTASPCARAASAGTRPPRVNPRAGGG